MVRWWSELGFVVKKGDKFVEDERKPIEGQSYLVKNLNRQDATSIELCPQPLSPVSVPTAARSAVRPV